MKLSCLADRLRRYAQALGRRAGFSLVEIVIALGIVSFALIAIVGMIPLGLSSLKDSVSDTTVSLLMTNIREAIVGQPFQAGALNPLFYDSTARYQGQTPDANSYYRVDVSLAPAGQHMPNSSLLVATVKIHWPHGALESETRSYRTSFFVTPLTGPGWQALDEDFQPKIGL